MPHSARKKKEVGEAVAEMHFVRAQPRYGASASALNADFDGEVYPMIQIIAQSAQNMVDYQCRASRDGERIELICNDARVFPWNNPGDMPGGAFRAQFHFFFNDTATTEIYTLSLHDALPIYSHPATNGHTDTEAPSGAITHGCSCSRSRHRRSSGCSDSPGRPSWSPPTWPAGTATTKIGRAHV